MGHLYRGGLWCKKRSYISGFNSTTAPASGSVVVTATEGRPAYQDLNKYFYLPNLGYYSINGAGTRGEDMSATFYGAAGISDFMTWGRDIEDLYGGWSYDGSGNLLPNDHYHPCSSTIYSSFGPNRLFTHIMNEKSLIFRRALPIYKFE